MPGFETYLLGKIRQVEVAYVRMNLSSASCGSVKRTLHSDYSIPATPGHSFIHNPMLTQTNSHIQHSHRSIICKITATDIQRNVRLLRFA